MNRPAMLQVAEYVEQLGRAFIGVIVAVKVDQRDTAIWSKLRQGLAFGSWRLCEGLPRRQSA
ncbi:hypothetical protein OO25_02525 [Phaeobacter sp. S60]|nr:hypothetical protein OO25_02525 [Phaeobacter sp. S60]